MKKLISIMAICLLSLSTSTVLLAQTKKDGSKDMRYKKNKQHLKKDGSVDKRFKKSH